jgi:predicted RNA-binding Zn-ribbon protein involved in translation (DUF1610 family)
MSEADTNPTYGCPKCGGQMERGGIRGESSTVWGRVKETEIFGVKAVQMSAPYYIVDAYRCEQCGYVELYAVNQQGK